MRCRLAIWTAVVVLFQPCFRNNFVLRNWIFHRTFPLAAEPSEQRAVKVSAIRGLSPAGQLGSWDSAVIGVQDTGPNPVEFYASNVYPATSEWHVSAL